MGRSIIRKALTVIAPLIALVTISILVSLIKFHVYNPIIVIGGLAKIKFQDEKWMELKIFELWSQ